MCRVKKYLFLPNCYGQCTKHFKVPGAQGFILYAPDIIYKICVQCIHWWNVLKIWLNLCTEHGYTTLFGVSACFIKISKCFMIFFQWRQRDTNPTNNWKVCYGVPTCPVYKLNQIFTRLLAHWHWKLFLPGHCKGVILYREGLIFQKLTTSNN